MLYGLIPRRLFFAINREKETPPDGASDLPGGGLPFLAMSLSSVEKMSESAGPMSTDQ